MPKASKASKAKTTRRKFQKPKTAIAAAKYKLTLDIDRFTWGGELNDVARVFHEEEKALYEYKPDKLPRWSRGWTYFLSYYNHMKTLEAAVLEAHFEIVVEATSQATACKLTWNELDIDTMSWWKDLAERVRLLRYQVWTPEQVERGENWRQQRNANTTTWAGAQHVATHVTNGASPSNTVSPILVTPIARFHTVSGAHHALQHQSGALQALEGKESASTLPIISAAANDKSSAYGLGMDNMAAYGPAPITFSSWNAPVTEDGMTASSLGKWIEEISAIEEALGADGHVVALESIAMVVPYKAEHYQ